MVIKRKHDNVEIMKPCQNKGVGLKKEPKFACKNMYPNILVVQSNLGDSNADFSKTPDFSNLTVSPDLFCYYLM